MLVVLRNLSKYSSAGVRSGAAAYAGIRQKNRPPLWTMTGGANTKMHRVWVATIAALLLAACAGPPVQEMSDARQAIEAAEEAGALEHAPMQLRFARDLISSAETKLEKRAYNGARRDARLAREKAVEALNMTLDETGQPRR